MSKHMKFGLRTQYEVQNLDCVTLKDVLNSLQGGADLLEEAPRDSYQVTDEEHLKEALKAPMGLVFISKMETGVDGHNPVFSDVAARLGLDEDFNPIKTEEL